MKVEDFMKKPEPTTGGVEAQKDNVVSLDAARREKELDEVATAMAQNYNEAEFVERIQTQGVEGFMDSLPRDGDQVAIPMQFVIDTLRRNVESALMFSLIHGEVPEMDAVLDEYEASANGIFSTDNKGDISVAVERMTKGMKLFEEMVQKYANPS